MFMIHWYVYEKELLERMRKRYEMSTALGRLPEHEVVINGKVRIAHKGLKEKRRDVKMLKEQIKALRGEQDHLAKIALPTQRERDRADRIVEELRQLEVEIWNTERMKYLGKGHLVVSDGMHQDA